MVNLSESIASACDVTARDDESSVLHGLIEALKINLTAARAVAAGDIRVEGILCLYDTESGGPELLMPCGDWFTGRHRPVPTPSQRATNDSSTYTLYRLYGHELRLLYVGITRNFPARMRAHRRKWGDLIQSVTTETYDDAEELMEAEMAAIRDERPMLNHDGIDER